MRSGQHDWRLPMTWFCATEGKIILFSVQFSWRDSETTTSNGSIWSNRTRKWKTTPTTISLTVTTSNPIWRRIIWISAWCINPKIPIIWESILQCQMAVDRWAGKCTQLRRRQYSDLIEFYFHIEMMQIQSRFWWYWYAEVAKIEFRRNG